MKGRVWGAVLATAAAVIASVIAAAAAAPQNDVESTATTAAAIPEVHRIRPQKGYFFGSTKIRITGSNFEETEQLACVFENAFAGESRSSATFVSSVEIECITPPMAKEGSLSVRVSLDDASVSKSKAIFALLPPPIISSIDPESGTTSGVAKVHLFGVGFLDGESTGCRFGNVTVPAEWVSTNVVICKPLTLNPSSGYATVSYTNDGIHFNYAEKQFLFIHLPTVVYISPKSGLKSANTTVRMRVDKIENTTGWTCSFGEVSTQAILKSSHEVECMAPPSHQDLVDIELLSTEHDLRIDTGFTFQYYHELEINSYFPELAPASGGTSIDIIINGLREDSSYACIFGTREVEASIVNNSTLNCISPVMMSYSETTTLTVKSFNTSPELTLVSNHVRFVLYQQPVIQKAYPNIFYAQYPPAELKISGYGFVVSKHMKCRIDDIEIEASFESEHQVVCHLTQMETDSLDSSTQLFFSMNGIDYIDSRVILRVLPELGVSSIQPDAGSNLGGISTTIIGVRFHQSLRYSCRFGYDLPTMDATFINSTSLRCISPNATHSGSTDFSLCLDGGECVGTDITYTFEEPLRLIEVLTRHGSMKGGTSVEVKTNMILTKGSYCLFGEERSPIHTDGNVGGYCLSPPFGMESDTSYAVKFHVSTEGHQFSQGSFYFIYHPAQILEQAMPKTDTAELSFDNNYPEELTIYEIIPAVLVRGSPYSKLKIDGLNFLTSNGTFPLERCHMGSQEASANLIQNASNTGREEFQCDFTELPLTGTYPLHFESKQFGNITASNATVQVIDNPILHYLEPAIVVPRDTVKVFVYGDNFVKHNLTCFINEYAYPATFLTSSQIICRFVGDELVPATHEVRVSNDGYYVKIPPLLLEVTTVPYIAELDPPVGISGGNTTLRGKGFHHEMKCHARNSGELMSQFINSSAVRCFLPHSYNTNSVPLSLMLADRIVSNVENFTVVDLRVNSMHPSFGSAKGNTPVSFALDKRSMDMVTYCKFGEILVSAIVGHDNTVICKTPPVNIVGEVRVELGVNERDFIDSGFAFEYIPNPAVSDVRPRFGFETGGKAVELIGSNFVNSSSLACHFDKTQADCQWESEEEITCVSPKLKPGNYSINVSLNGVDVIDTSLEYQVRLQMTTVFTRPSFASITGGATIQVFGTNFQRDDALACRFGNSTTPAFYIGPNVIECTTPSHGVSEIVDLGIVSETKDVSIVENGFEFLIPFELSSIRPDSGSVKGGTDVSVDGSGFAQARDPVYCNFGSSAVIASIVSDNELACSSPSTTSAGSVDFSITHGADMFPLAPRLFSYNEEITVDAMQSRVISSERGHDLVVYGSNFRLTQDLACKLDNGKHRLKATFVSDTQIFCRLDPGLPPSEYSLHVTNNGQELSISSANIHVVDPFKIHFIVPSIGSPGVTTSVSLHGRDLKNFNGLGCLVNNELTSLRFVDSSEIHCTIPSEMRAGMASIAVASNGLPISNQLNLTLVDVKINSIYPVLGDTKGGTPVVVVLEEGSNNNITHCMFGEVVIEAVVANNELLCESPAMTKTGSMQFGLSVNGRDFQINSDIMFEYHSPVTIMSIFPINGPESGNTLVTIYGANFIKNGNLTCHFGKVKVAGRWVSKEKITCNSPMLKPGSHAVSVSMNDVDIISSYTYYRSDHELDVLMVLPSISMSTGTHLTILGKSFVPSDDLYCSFGEYGTTLAVYVGPTEINCRSPEIGISDVVSANVRVSLNGVDFSTSSAPFHISPLPEVKSISPLKGIISGGTQIMVEGSNFISADMTFATCMFGPFSVPGMVLSSTELTCVSPPIGDDGDVEFTVSMNGVDTAQATSFMYLPKITTTSIEPTIGSFIGGTLVTVTGMDFTESHSIHCHFGEKATVAMFVDEQKIQCKTPSHPSGVVSFYVEAFGTKMEGDLAFEFYTPHQIVSAFPTNGPYHGGTLIKVRGRHFQSNVDYVCLFDNATSSPAQYISSDFIDCSSPAMIEADSPRKVTFEIAEKESGYTHGELSFTFGQPFSLDYIQPKIVPFEGGLGISLFGEYFDSTEVYCRFILNSESIITILGELIGASNRVDCEVPPHTMSQNQAEAYVQVSSNAYDWSNSLPITYVSRPSIVSIHPVRGSVSGGTRILVTGSNFGEHHELWCNFEGVGSVRAEWESRQEMYCISPRVSSKPLSSAVSLRTEDGTLIGDDDDAQEFHYHRDLLIEEVFPTRGFITGGSRLTIFGTGFIDVDTINCHFGNVMVKAAFVSSTSIECTTPSVNDPQVVQLGVSLNGYDVVIHSGLMFHYDSIFEFDYVTPSNVPINHEYGYAVIFGNSFVIGTHLRCMFGDTWITGATVVSESQVKCDLPNITKPGKYPVSISVDGGDFSHESIDISFVESAVITSIRPSTVQEGSDAILTISGDNFVSSPDLQCRFGELGLLWTPAVWVSKSTVECNTPLLNLTADGHTLIGITNNGGHSVSAPFPLEVTARARFLSMYPSQGYITGGTDISIVLGHLRHIANRNMRCKIGETFVPATISRSVISCLSPANSPGHVLVLLMLDGEIHPLASGSFEYVDEPMIESLHPNIASVDGGTPVVLGGSGFQGLTHCRFNDHVVPVDVLSDDSRVVCLSPESDFAKDVIVQVTHNGQDFSSSGVAFSYRTNPTLRDLMPSYGGANTGGKTVYIAGSNFSPSPLLSCRFGALIVEATFISESMLSCKTPPMKLGKVSLAISLNRVEFVSSELFYHSINLPQMSSMHPRVGVLSGNTTVMFNTTALPETDKLACHFGDKIVQATYLSKNSLSCVAPNVVGATRVNVSISVDGERLYPDEDQSFEFEYVDHPAIDYISPAFGWTVGGSNTTIAVKDLEPFHTHDLTCSFGSGVATADKLTKANRVDDGVISCLSPKFDDNTMAVDAPIILAINDGINSVRVIGPSYRYLNSSTINRIEPSIGSVHGGSIVQLYGTNFSNITGQRCFFGDDTSAIAEWISQHEVRCVSPAYKGEGKREVLVHLGMQPNVMLSIESHASFSYLSHPIISDFHPRFGSSSGGTKVILSLVHPWQNATDHLACRFGNSSSVMAKVVSDDEVSCITPPKEDVQKVPISIYATHGLARLASSNERFGYMDHINIQSLKPNSVPLRGGTALRVRASGLAGVDPSVLTCHFGDDAVVPVSSCVENSNEWDCDCVTPPTNTRRVVLFELGLSGLRDVPSKGHLFTFYNEAEIHSINPPIGFLEGGELVHVRGVNFRNTQDLKCTFGDLESIVFFVSSTELVCTSPSLGRTAALQVQVSNNGVDFTQGGKEYRYIHRPDASALAPSVVQWDANSSISITGKHLSNVKSCLYGDIERTYPAFNITEHTFSCEYPPSSLYLKQSLSEFNVTVFLEMENGLLPTWLDIQYIEPPPKEVIGRNEAVIKRIEPNYATSSGGQWVRIYGEGFHNSRELRCIFGDALGQQAIYVSDEEIHCMTPKHIPDSVSLRVSNSGSLATLNDGFNFTFNHDFSITSVSPLSGSTRGGAAVNLYGSFLTSEMSAMCKFGVHGVVLGEIISQSHITCVSPKASKVDTIELSLSMDGGINYADSTVWFTYELEAEILDISPSYGYRLTNTTSSILVTGKNFKHDKKMVCLFGDVKTAVRYISNEKVMCDYPPTDDANLERVPLSVVVDGDVSLSWRHFEYFDPPIIMSYSPNFGGATVEVDEVIVKGNGFQKIIQLFCNYGNLSVRAAVIDPFTLKCPIPSHPPGQVRFSVVDDYSYLSLDFVHGASSSFYFIPESSIHSILPTWNASKAGSLSFVKGSNFNAEFGSSVSITLAKDLAIVTTDMPQYVSHDLFMFEPRDLLPATNGTYMSSASSHNLTLCEPGTFQPQNGQNHCLICPVGYICPMFGMARPMTCPRGFICSRLGLSAPSSPCIAGHYCLEGTKMATQIVDSSTDKWNLDKMTGVVTASIVNVGTWDYMPRENPATGWRRIFHPPDHANITAHQPFPCELGHYCRVGVSTTEHIKGDFSTPQLCHTGHFCPRGSISAEGSGACPSGFYCSTQDLAIACDVGHYCPGTGNTFPLPCFPGSFSNLAGQSSCNLCEVGYQCPGWGRIEPEACQVGYVCDQPGLSIPAKPCPPGYYCETGTTTDDPQSLSGKPPLSCPSGLFCLRGVAHRDLSPAVGLPSFDMSFPQSCAEGYYCSSNSSIPLGDGPCFPGHYCPTSSNYPVQVPPGTFASDSGSIVPSLCLPGTFSPRPGSILCSPCPAGFSCLSYGTFVPRICGPGTYRSKADSIPCKLCPERTFSHESGLTDISQCLPCLEGRVCARQGLADVSSSDVCPEGQVCGYVNNRASQYSQECVGGCFCGNETSITNQYSNYCSSGHYCLRGTSAKLNTERKCPKRHFCSMGSSHPEHFMTRCPRLTSSSRGSKVIESCAISPVAVCDKKSSNPFDVKRYYPSEEDDVGEVEVVRQVLPFNTHSSNAVQWRNDTVEVFRSCPTFGLMNNNNVSTEGTITVIGRNFRNTTNLTCRFRLCQSTQLTYLGQKLIFPNTCEGNTTNFNAPAVLGGGTFLNENRVICDLPDITSMGDFEPLLTTSLPQSKAMVCMSDRHGKIYLSKECSDTEVLSGSCVFEPTIPSLGLRKRIYSLFIPCIEAGEANMLCSNALNPCLTQQISVDISNNGYKFTGDETFVPYISDMTSDSSEDSFILNSTFAVYSVIRNETVDVLDNARDAIDYDMELCHRPSVHEEGVRLNEDGWFMAEYMSRIIMSFDWRHIPNHIIYNHHFKLAIYVVPSRCSGSKCNNSERKSQMVEDIPCLQPMELPLWFEHQSVDKHQIMNLTMLALDDALFKVEVQIMNGAVLPMADFFKQSMTLTVEQPERAKTSGEDKATRSLSPLVSWEESPTSMSYMFGMRYDESMFDQVSPPMNLPPRWKNFERGRMLLSMNTTVENSVPTIKDYANTTIRRNKDFWSNPYPSASIAKEETDLFFETWHGITLGDSGTSYKYDHDSVILPYLPYFSNCREFDSYIPLWAVVESTNQCNLPGVTAIHPQDWWRRQIPSLPHQDDVKSVGPQNVIEFYPIADWCERKLHCQYEENLPEPDVLPRWFEADTGVTLFSIIREPIDYYEYTGRDAGIISNNDGGGQRFIKSVNEGQRFIPVKVDRSPAFNVEGGCTTACFPRKVTLDISYQQVDVHTKRIVQVKLLYDRFDKDSSNDRYELQVKFYALNYQELVIKFAFERELFLLLFAQMGLGTVIAAFIYWIVIRVTTRLEEPPSIRILGFLWRIFPPAFGGVLLGLGPICVVTGAVYYLLKGHEHFGPESDPEGRRWLLLPTIQLNYSDASIDPDLLHSTRQGRTGVAFLCMALVSLYFTTQIYVPKRKQVSNSTSIVPYNEHVFKSISWRRSNLIYSSILMSLLSVAVVEWSFWASFGTYIWEAIIFMKFLSMIIGSIVDAQLGEALLSAPVMTAMGLVQGIVTMSANDFMDFLLSYIVGFGFLIIERMYIGPLQADFMTWAAEKIERVRCVLFLKSSDEVKDDNASDQSLEEENNETLEPLLGSFANYSCDTLSLLYYPFIMVVIMIFRDEVEITKIYGIKEADMEYYVLFAVAIIPFQILADVLLHNSLELLHGWKTLDYLEYCRVRFYQREVWWKGFESNTLDECIEESLRSIDQMCFSSQYYMLNTIHVNAIVYLVVGIEMMIRANYNLFGDPAMIPILAYVIGCSAVVRILMIFVGQMFGVWRVRLRRRDWHAKMQVEHVEVEQLGDGTATDHDLFQQQMRITDETFRYKFLRYNRSWIINQLPDMLTPRVTQKSRPYLINQLARVLGSINADISSDSSDDDEFEYEMGAMAASQATRTMARKWMIQAQRLLKLRKIVQPIIQQSRGNECDVCLSLSGLQVETFYTLEQIDDMFQAEFGSSNDELDQVLLQKFFRRTQRYQTICLSCIQDRERKRENKILDDDRGEDMAPEIAASSSTIMELWYKKARARLSEAK